MPFVTGLFVTEYGIAKAGDAYSGHCIQPVSTRPLREAIFYTIGIGGLCALTNVSATYA